jgi:PKHD-type hydroxylase
MNKERYMHFFVCKDNLLTEEELNKIIQYCDSSNIQQSELLIKGKVATDYGFRKSKNSFIEPNKDNEWIFKKLKSITEQVNANTYNFDVSYGFRFMQYAVYEDGGHFDFHIDTILAEGSVIDDQRKLSVSLVLSDSSEYEGGDFQFYTGGEAPTTIKQEKGRFIFFPPWLLHRVTPVKSGVRKSLVFWMQGPNFK